MDNQITHSPTMERAAFILGIISILSCTFCYFSLPAGSLAIIFASLSRGGSRRFSQRAKIALALGLIGIAATIGVYGYAIYYAFHKYGTLDEIIKAYAPYSGMSYEELQTLLGL